MHACGSASNCWSWLLAAMLGGLGLVFAASGCNRINQGGGQDAPPDRPPSSQIGSKPLLPLIPEPVKLESEAVFMGTRAIGQRFCIIADASNSMRGTPLNQLKQEILQTLDGLEVGSQFYVIFFNATDIPMPYPNWLDVGKENVDKVRPWVKNVGTSHRTLPQSAFTRAFQLKPRPDVIFFMTDGLIQGKRPEPVSHINNLNQTAPKVAIYTIMFSNGKAGTAKVDAAAAQLRGIAERNGGTFRHVSPK